MIAPTIYLDYQATTPLDPRALEAMLPYLTDIHANPSSPHSQGQQAAETVRAARRQLQTLVGAAHESEIVFTSGATESNHLAIIGAAAAAQRRGNHIVTTVIEHKSVLAASDRLARAGFAVTHVPVGSDGRVDPGDIERALTPRTVLVSMMHANNEIGTIQPLTEIAAVTRTYGVLLHTDVAQSIGTIPFDIDRLGVDLASISGHKIYGPKGIGALYVRQSMPIEPQLTGGGQEYGLRAGTLNVPGIVGLGCAAAILTRERSTDAERVLALRERLRQRLTRALPGVRVNGSLEHRLPGNLSLTIPGLESSDLIAALPDLAISGGSACNTGQPEPSHVLTAIGLEPADARCTLRLSLGRFTTVHDVEHAATRLIFTIRHLLPARPTPSLAASNTSTSFCPHP
ncbi:MAG: cysteine desulfurase family protein [Egibacteraceae bacterium]